MANGHFGQSECAKGILLTLGLDGGAVKACMGDSEADKDHPLLQVAPQPWSRALSSSCKVSSQRGQLCSVSCIHSDAQSHAQHTLPPQQSCWREPAS